MGSGGSVARGVLGPAWAALWWSLLLSTGLLPEPLADAMTVAVNHKEMPNIWTPVMSGIGLAPEAYVHVELETLQPCPEAYVVLLTEAQVRRAAPLLHGLGTRANSFRTVGAHQRVGLPSSRFLSCAWRASLASSVNASFQVVAPEAARYVLGIVQLQPAMAHDLRGVVGFVNPGGCQLPIQLQNALFMWPLVAWAFALLSGFCLVVCALRPRSCSLLHALFIATMALKCLMVLLVRLDEEHMYFSGKQELGRRMFWKFVRQVQICLEILTFYTISLGWKIMRDRLRPAEWGFAASVCSVSFLLGMFEAVCSFSPACSSRNCTLMQFSFHSLCFLVVIIATNFNIFTLERQIADALALPDTSDLYAKHRSYSWFRGIFLFYVLVPTLCNFFSLHIVNWDQLWVIIFVREGSLWIIFAALLWLFQPGLVVKLRVFDLAVIDSSDSSDQE